MRDLSMRWRTSVTFEAIEKSTTFSIKQINYTIFRPTSKVTTVRALQYEVCESEMGTLDGESE